MTFRTKKLLNTDFECICLTASLINLTLVNVSHLKETQKKKTDEEIFDSGFLDHPPVSGFSCSLHCK